VSAALRANNASLGLVEKTIRRPEALPSLPSRVETPALQFGEFNTAASRFSDKQDYSFGQRCPSDWPAYGLGKIARRGAETLFFMAFLARTFSVDRPK